MRIGRYEFDEDEDRDYLRKKLTPRYDLEILTIVLLCLCVGVIAWALI